MEDTHLRFSERPSAMSEEVFVERFGGVYEHSEWIARDLHACGLTPAHDTVEGLASGLCAMLARAGRDAKLALIRAHPDLAGRAAVRGQLTAESTGEQTGAGLDQCSPEEFRRFEAFNSAYKAKFAFPFVMAVRGSNRHLILAAFESRLQNDPSAEFDCALAEITRIARLRLRAIAGS